MSLYAGGHAERKLDPTREPTGIWGDEEDATDWLARSGWEHREEELRRQSAELVDKHWREIEAVAAELLERKTLDDTEVELIAEATVGVDGAANSLQQYRALRAASTEQP